MTNALGAKFCKLLVVALTLSAATARQITVYDDHHGDGPRGSAGSTHDYSDDAPGSDAGDDENSSGFAQPLDFSSFFSSGFGAAQSGGGNFFLPASSEVKPFTLPLSAGGSPFADELQASASSPNGTTGFTSPAVKFQSFFDAGGSEAGFRAQDFLATPTSGQDAATAANSPADFFSPPSDFASEQHASFGGEDHAPSGFGSDGHSSSEFGGGDHSPFGFGYDGESAGNQGQRAAEYKSEAQPAAKGDKYADADGKSSYPKQRGGHSAAGPSAPTRSYTPSGGKASVGPTGYPVKSSASYNPSGPYVSKSGYGEKNVGKYRGSQGDHESKSGYPKKASEFYPTKVGARYTSAASQPDRVPSSYPSYSNARISSFADVDDFLPAASNPYTPSEYGRDSENYRSASSPSDEDVVDEAVTTITVSSDNKNCRRVDKQVSKDNTMTCYICEDPKTGGNFEKCSYESDPEAKSQSYFHGHGETFSSDKGKKPTSYRYRRGLAGFDYKRPYGSGSVDSARSRSEPRVRVARQQKGSPSDSSNYRTNYDDYIASFAQPSQGQYRYKPERYTATQDPDYNPAPATADQKDCKTVVKGTMTCSVCQNAKTGGSSEQCSYATKPEGDNYFVARQTSFNTKNKPYHKESSSARSTQPQAKAGEGEREELRNEEPSSKVPYESSTESAFIVTRRGEHKGPLNDDAFVYQADRRSHAPSGERNAKTSSQGAEKNYDDYFKELFPEVVAARRSDSHHHNNNNNNDDDDVSYTGSPSEAYKVDRSVEEFDDSHRKANSPKSQSYRPSSSEDFGASKPTGKSHQISPKKRQSSQRNGPVPNYNNKPVADFDEYNQEYVQQSPSNGGKRDTSDASDEYYKAASTLPDYFADTAPKRDLETVLGEFSQKDRSACKKVIRDRMTCYQCVDKQGMQHEECMFVAASAPQSQHVAYHEVKEFRPTLTPPTTGPTLTGRKQRAVDAVMAASEVAEATAEATTESFVDVAAMFPLRTERKFDAQLGVSLPAFMLERSEHERVFDEVLAAGI